MIFLLRFHFFFQILNYVYVNKEYELYLYIIRK